MKTTHYEPLPSWSRAVFWILIERRRSRRRAFRSSTALPWLTASRLRQHGDIARRFGLKIQILTGYLGPSTTLSVSRYTAAKAVRVERAMGIEPTAQAWEAWVLPLYDARQGLDSSRVPKRRQIVGHAGHQRDQYGHDHAEPRRKCPDHDRGHRGRYGLLALPRISLHERAHRQ